MNIFTDIMDANEFTMDIADKKAYRPVVTAWIPLPEPYKEYKEEE